MQNWGHPSSLNPPGPRLHPTLLSQRLSHSTVSVPVLPSSVISTSSRTPASQVGPFVPQARMVRALLAPSLPVQPAHFLPPSAEPRPRAARVPAMAVRASRSGGTHTLSARRAQLHVLLQLNFPTPSPLQTPSLWPNQSVLCAPLPGPAQLPCREGPPHLPCVTPHLSLQACCEHPMPADIQGLSHISKRMGSDAWGCLHFLFFYLFSTV